MNGYISPDEEKFEFIPQFSIVKPMAHKELMKASGLTRESFNKRLQKQKIERKEIYSPDECNTILNELTDARNWNIVGYQTITKVCKDLHCLRIHMQELIKTHNIPVINQQIYLQGYVWISNNSIRLIKNILDRTNEEKKYTTLAIATKLGLPIEKLREILRKYPVPHGKAKDGQNIYTEENAKLVEENVQIYFGLKKKREAETLESLMKKHPLVKDERCFELSYFPDPTPDCFRDCDDWDF